MGCEEGADEEGFEVRESGRGEVVDRAVVFFGKAAGDVGQVEGSIAMN